MNGSVLFDTNIVIALFSGDENVLKQISKSEEILIPAIVIGELYYGAQNSIKKYDNLLKIKEFSQSVTVLNCDSNTAFTYGVIKKHLKDGGTPIPENDIWIAALAAQYELTLITRDKHFNQIHQVKSQIW